MDSEAEDVVVEEPKPEVENKKDKKRKATKTAEPAAGAGPAPEVQPEPNGTAVQAADDVVDPCNVCLESTFEGNRIQEGSKTCPCYLHKPCRNAARALDSRAKAEDAKKKDKNNTAQKKLSDHKKNDPDAWRVKVLGLVVKEGSMRGAAERERASRYIEEILQIGQTFNQRQARLLPRRAFIAHYRYKEGYSQEEAEAEWESAKNDTSLPSETKDGELHVLCRKRDKWVDQSGVMKRKPLQEDQYVNDATGLQTAANKSVVAIDTRVAAFHEAGGKHFKAGVGHIAGYMKK